MTALEWIGAAIGVLVFLFIAGVIAVTFAKQFFEARTKYWKDIAEIENSTKDSHALYRGPRDN